VVQQQMKSQMLDEPSLSPVACHDLEAIDEIDNIVEAATVTGTDAAVAMAIAKWVLPVPVPTNARL
jgi:hypothetical protein